MKTLIFIFLTASSLFSQAARNNNRAEDVAQIYYSAKCHQKCQNGVSVDQYQKKDFARLPGQVFRTLEKVAYEQAQIWGDTILEGDYAADGKVQIDTVLVIKQNYKIIGYAVNYSERAWFVGDCAYVHRVPSTLVSCEEGRIDERSFVSENLVESTVDQNQFADFTPKD